VANDSVESWNKEENRKTEEKLSEDFEANPGPGFSKRPNV
jgi:hypothetical protein